MRPVLVNGLGCFEGGSRLVLRELMKVVPAGVRVWVVLVADNRADIDAKQGNIRVIALNHRLFGRWLRPLYELLLWLAVRCGFVSRVVNLSNYGFCAGGG